MDIGVEFPAIALGHEAHELRIAKTAPRIAAQSEPDGGAMANVEQGAEHSVICQNCGSFFQDQSREHRGFTRIYRSSRPLGGPTVVVIDPAVGTSVIWISAVPAQHFSGLVAS